MLLSLAACKFPCSGQEPVLGKDPPEGFVWSAPKDGEMSFRPISMDGESHMFFMKRGDFFAPVKFEATRAVSEKYPADISEKIYFYTRKMEGDKPIFTPAFSVKTGGLKDAIVAIHKSDSGVLRSACVDISLEKMPLGSFSVVNMSLAKMAFGLEKLHFVLPPFNSKSVEFSSSEPEIKSATLRTYDLRDKKAPKLILSKTYNFWTDRRMIVLVFEPPKFTGEEFTDSNIPATILHDKGPR